MTSTEFKLKYSGELKTFLESPMGRELLAVTHGCRPALKDSFSNEHDMLRTYARGEGFEQCLRVIVSLASLPVVQKEPEANYGIVEKEVK